MAEQFLFNLAEGILLKLGSSAIQQIALAHGVQKELKKLEHTMSTVTNVILDAEEQQVTNRAVKKWLKRLKDIVYDVDELFDEFETESLLRQVETGGSKMKEVRYFFTKSNPWKVRYSIGRKTRDVREKLDVVVADMKNFEFAVRIVNRPFEFRRREETHSFVRDSEVIGRESDKEAIIQTLVCADSKELVVLPIVGMGGLGKTTLAQFVYNDKRIDDHFSRKLWVCVSDNFDLKTIIGKILKVAGDDRVDDKLELEQLQARLREKLAGGNFFLVLDDIWNEDRVEWIKLRDLLMVSGGESRILVTTRSKVVASITGTVPSYDVKGLSNEDCLSVLGKWAFQERDFEKHRNLVNIGREIVKKCGGVPLAVRSLGGLLYSKTNEKDWLRVRDNEVWTFVQKENDILPILKLSYDQLPSSLKNCFAYCSFIEKDELIQKWRLIYLWMAQGFIKSSNPNEELEVIGEQYLNEFVMRSFLQKDGDDCYRMHDVVHDLALYVAGGECFYLRSGVEFVPDGVRHVALMDGVLGSTLNHSHLLKSSLKGKKLRSIWLLERISTPKFTSTFNVTDVRVLCLRMWGNQIFKDSKIFEDSNYLRYLDLTGFGSPIPDSITRLVNLQYLAMARFINELPKNFGNLVNLRYLSISYSSMLKNLSEKDIGGLINLRILLFNLIAIRSLPEGIGRLTCLRILEINSCRDLDSLPSGMRHLTALEHLTIKYCFGLKLSEDDLQGLKSLKVLKLHGIKHLESLPKGLHNDSAASLTHIKIKDCWNLKSLMESFANFTSLEKLDIFNCKKLSSLPEGMEGLTTLQSLSLKGCPYLTLRCEKGGEDWHKISHVPYLHII